MKPPEIVYKGISVEKVIEHNQERGGVILSTCVEGQTFEITTDYFEITHSTDRLVYENDLLISWELIYHDKTYLLFSREEYDQIKKEVVQNVPSTTCCGRVGEGNQRTES